MIPILAAATTGTANTTVQGWLNTLIPISQIAQIFDANLYYFILIAVMLLTIGFVISLAGSEDPTGPIVTTIVLFACMAGTPWLMSMVQSIANGLLTDIAYSDASLNWLVVNDPGTSSLALNYTQPFTIIGKYIDGASGTPPAASIMELGKWPDYLMRLIVISLTGCFAAIAVFIMQVMLIIQKLILVMSAPIMPIFIAALSIPASRGSSQNFIKAVIGVMCWPIGWALVHVGTMAALNNLTPPSWNASLGQLILSFITLGVICIWMIFGTILAPSLIHYAVTHGSNFAAGLVGGTAAAAGQYASSIGKAAATVGGALLGSPLGIGGVLAGAGVGAMLGDLLQVPIGGAGESLSRAATQSLKGDTGAQDIVSTKASTAAADAALNAIKKRV